MTAWPTVMSETAAEQTGRGPRTSVTRGLSLLILLTFGLEELALRWVIRGVLWAIKSRGDLVWAITRTANTGCSSHTRPDQGGGVVFYVSGWESVLCNLD